LFENTYFTFFLQNKKRVFTFSWNDMSKNVENVIKVSEWLLYYTYAATHRPTSPSAYLIVTVSVLHVITFTFLRFLRFNVFFQIQKLVTFFVFCFAAYVFSNNVINAVVLRKDTVTQLRVHQASLILAGRHLLCPSVIGQKLPVYGFNTPRYPIWVVPSKNTESCRICRTNCIGRLPLFLRDGYQIRINAMDVWCSIIQKSLVTQKS